VRRNRPVHVEVLSQWPSTIQMFADGMVVDRGKVRRPPASMWAFAVNPAS